MKCLKGLNLLLVDKLYDGNLVHMQLRGLVCFSDHFARF